VGLRSRLTLFFALATALLVGVAALGFVLQLRVSLDATLDTALDTRAASLGERLADTGPANLRLDHDEEPVQVLSLSGQFLASSPDLAVASPLTPPSSRPTRPVTVRSGSLRTWPGRGQVTLIVFSIVSRRRAVVAALAPVSRSFVPTCSRITSGCARPTQPATSGCIRVIVQPAWPSWSRSRSDRP
jgi:hypothetical protein